MKGKLLLACYLIIAITFIIYGVRNATLTIPRFILPTPPRVGNPSPPVTGTVRIERVVDGDTVVVEGNKKIRYIGIDTPETVDPRRGVGCFGKEASDKNKSLVEGKYVRLEKDVSDTDTYGRLLRYVWVYETPDATGSGIFVNEVLVKEGYARAATFPPDVRYADLFRKLQESARQENKGLWNACN